MKAEGSGFLGVVCWGWGIGGGDWLVLRVLGSAIIGDIGDISVIGVAGVGHVLDSAIGKSNRVSSLDIASTIRGLLGVEGSLGVVISNSVGEGVGRDLIGVGLSLVCWGGVVGGSRGVVGRGSLHDNWSSMDSVVDWGMVGHDHWSVVNSVVHWGMVGHVDWVDSVVGMVATIGSNNSEQGSTDKSLKPKSN